MALSKEIKQLIALAAQDPIKPVRPHMRGQPKKRPINAQNPDAVQKARPSADYIFQWIDGPTGDELRAEMTEHGTDLLPLHGYRVGMSTERGVLHIQREPNPLMGAADSAYFDVHSPEELINAVGPEIVMSIHHQIVNDQLFTSMAAHLRQRSPLR